MIRTRSRATPRRALFFLLAGAGLAGALWLASHSGRGVAGVPAMAAPPAGDGEADRWLRLAHEVNASGRHREALAHYRAACDAATSAAKRVHVTASMVEPCLQLGLFGEALEALEEARRAFASLAPPDRTSEMRLRMGEVRGTLGLGLLDQVREPLERWQTLLDQGPLANEAIWRARLTESWLDWFNQTHQFERAIAHADGLAPDLRGSTAVEHRLGIARWARGEDELALQAFERVHARAPGPDALLMQVETRLAELHWDAGREERARELIASASARRAASVQLQPESFEDFLHLAAVRHRIGLARPSELEEAFARVLDGWEQCVPPPGGLPILGPLRQRMFVVELMEARLREQPGEAGRLHALEALCQLQRLGTLARALRGAGPRPWASLAELRRSLTSERSGLLIYLSGRHEGFVFALDAHEVRCAAIAGELELVAEGRELLAWIVGDAPKSGAELARRGARLADLLFPRELHSQLERWSGAGLVGLGHLGSLPVELLPLAGRRLEEHLALGRPLSLHALDALNGRPDSRADVRSGAVLLVVAPPVGPDGPDGKPARLEALPFDGACRAALAGGLELTCVRAGRAATLEGELSSLRVLLVVTHGLSDERRGGATALLLADGAGRPVWVGPAELERLRLPPVVVLLACGSAQGPPRHGDDGVGDLAGACLRAGAQVVFLAPHPIDYDDACVLSGLLLDELRAGEAPSAALRRARLGFLARSPAADPTRGLLQVFGLGTRPVF